MCVNSVVASHFKQRELQILQLIKDADISYKEVGVFGSYARNDYKSSSDIDFLIITNNRPDRVTSGSLREEAEILGADIIFVTSEYFRKDESQFAQQIRRDYRRLL